MDKTGAAITAAAISAAAAAAAVVARFAATEHRIYSSARAAGKKVRVRENEVINRHHKSTIFSSLLPLFSYFFFLLSPLFLSPLSFTERKLKHFSFSFPFFIVFFSAIDFLLVSDCPTPPYPITNRNSTIRNGHLQWRQYAKKKKPNLT